MKIATVLIGAVSATLLMATAHADRAYDDWNAWWRQEGVKGETNCRLRPAYHSDYEFNLMISAGGSEETFDLVHMRGAGGKLTPGILTISVDGHAFKPLHPDVGDSGFATDELPDDIFQAMSSGQAVRLVYQARGGAKPITIDISLKGFGEAAAACFAGLKR